MTRIGAKRSGVNHTYQIDLRDDERQLLFTSEIGRKLLSECNQHDAERLRDSLSDLSQRVNAELQHLQTQRAKEASQRRQPKSPEGET